MTPGQRVAEAWFATHREWPNDQAWAENLADRIDAVIVEARARMIRAMCGRPNGKCVLNNGRVWEFCQAQRLITAGVVTEEEAAAAIRARGEATKGERG